MIHYQLDTLSLRDLQPEYLQFLSQPHHCNIGKRAQTTAWIRARCGTAPPISTLESESHLTDRQPPSMQHRFVWGDYAALSYTWGDESDKSVHLPTDQATNRSIFYLLFAIYNRVKNRPLQAHLLKYVVIDYVGGL